MFIKWSSLETYFFFPMGFVWCFVKLMLEKVSSHCSVPQIIVHLSLLFKYKDNFFGWGIGEVGFFNLILVTTLRQTPSLDGCQSVLLKTQGHTSIHFPLSALKSKLCKIHRFFSQLSWHSHLFTHFSKFINISPNVAIFSLLPSDFVSLSPS